MYAHTRPLICVFICLVGKDELEKVAMKKGAGGFWVGYFKDGTEFETTEPNVKPLSEDLIVSMCYI